jgi:hypothetical protein
MPPDAQFVMKMSYEKNYEQLDFGTALARMNNIIGVFE